MALVVALGGGRAAFGVDECGAAAPGGTVTCTPAGNPYQGGIQYKVADLTVVIESGVLVDTRGKAGEPGGIVLGGAGNYGTLEILAFADYGQILTIITDDADADGVSVQTLDGKVDLTLDANITTSGTDAIGIDLAGDQYVRVDSYGRITTSGAGALGIRAISTNGSAFVNSDNIIVTTGTGATGILAASTKYSADVSLNGSIKTSGDNASGIRAVSADSGASIDVFGQIVTEGQDSIGAYANGKYASIRITGDVSTKGADAFGLYSKSSGPQAYAKLDGTISTAGDNAAGIRISADNALAVANATGAITTVGKDSDAISIYSKDGVVGAQFQDLTITTSGESSNGVDLRSKTGDAVVYGQGQIKLTGAQSDGLFLETGGAGEVRVRFEGDIETAGKFGLGLLTYSEDGDTKITFTGDIITHGTYADAILASSKTGDVTITMDGDITTSRGRGIVVGTYGAVSVQHSGTIVTKSVDDVGIDLFGEDGVRLISAGAISTSGTEAHGIQALAVGGGTIDIVARTDIETEGTLAAGIWMKTDGAGKIGLFAFNDIVTDGNSADGILAKTADGSITITADGDITTEGDDSQGVDATSTSGTIQVLTSGDITTSGDEAQGMFAKSDTGRAHIYAQGNIVTSGADAEGMRVEAAAVSAFAYTTGDISTEGEDSTGIHVSATGTADGLARVRGDITTAGNFAIGIRVSSEQAIAIDSIGDIATAGRSAHAISAFAAGAGNVAVFSDGDIVTTGKIADAISAIADTGDVTLGITGSVTASGEAAHAITAETDGKIVLSILGDVQAGWNGGDAININGAVADLSVGTGSEIGSWSDNALVDSDSKLTVISVGAFTGSADLGKGDDRIENFGAWNLRMFADEDGDQTRDQESVAQMAFGADADEFLNNGTLSLSNVSGAGSWDTTGQILHPGGGNSDITQEGIEQGFLTGLETFNHAGLITLSDGVAGDLLVITDQADGKTKGAGLFESNGGALALDVVLDDGSSKQSDVLILDNAKLGSGATRVIISNAGGLGGQTTGDGILVVNVRDTSDAGAFALGNKPVAGAYQYELVYQNAAKNDQNWYLHSSFFDGSLEYPAISGGLLESWQSGLGSLHDQIRARRALTEAQDSNLAALPQVASDAGDGMGAAERGQGAGQAGWFRVSGADLEYEQTGPTDFELNTTRAEAGFDLGFDNVVGDGDWLLAGAFAGYGWSQLGFESGARADFDIATVGAYATYFKGPYYLDALVKLDWFDGNYRSEFVSDDGDLDLPVFGVSLETGYRFDLTSREGGGGLFLQPQAQLSFAHAGADSFTDDSGSGIALESAESLRGRIGARIGQELISESGAARGTFYLETSVNHEFLGETEAKASGLTLSQDLPGTSFEIGGGFDIALPAEGVSFTLDADYSMGDEVEGVTATGGFRITW